MNKVRMRLKEKPISDRIPAEIKQYIDDLRTEDRKMILELSNQVVVLAETAMKLTDMYECLNRELNSGTPLRPHKAQQQPSLAGTYIDAGTSESLRDSGVDIRAFSREIERHADRYGLHDVRVYVENRLLASEMRVMFRWREGDWQQLTWTQIVPMTVVGRNTPRDESVQERLMDGLLSEWRRLYGNPTPTLNIRITDHT
jgi:hypothetical protein